MKRITLILIFLTFTASISFSQNLENVGAGVIDFLLRNPKTANKMNTTETVALDIIGDLLKTESQRKHQLQYASAGRNQVTINLNDGRQAQFVKSENGKVFLLIDGVIYPIATELVNQAKGIETNVSSNTSYNSKSFDLNKLNTDYNSSNTYYFRIKTAIPFKWVQDLDENGFIEFNEIKQIKKQFYDNENFQILVNYETNNNCNENLILTIIDDYSGNQLFHDKYIIPWKEHKNRLQYFQISAGSLPIGNYIYKVKLQDRVTNTVHNVFIEKFEIVQGNSGTREVSYNEKKYRQNNVSYSCPKNIFFCTSWNDLNKNGKYDFNEFNGLNKSSYSLSKDSLWVSLNFPGKTGEIIIQSWTKDGKLLGTTTKSYQRLMTNMISPNSNPYNSMDFIDMVKINGVGEYKITVNFVEGGKHEQKLVISE